MTDKNVVSGDNAHPFYKWAREELGWLNAPKWNFHKYLVGRDGRLVPYAAFTDPQLARVGLSEREARERGIAFETATMPFGNVSRAIEAGVPAGTMKVLVDPETERLLGAAVVGAQAGELIHVFALLMRSGASARTIVDMQMIHPTFAEGLQSLVMRLDRFALKPRPDTRPAPREMAPAGD